MLVNVTQYRGPVVPFNNRTLCFDKNTNENVTFQRLTVNTKTPLELSYKAIFYLAFLILIFSKKSYICKKRKT